MKYLSIILAISSTSLFAQGYRCEGYCGGLDVRNNRFYDSGYMHTEMPGHPHQGHLVLMKKCQKTLPPTVRARIYRNIEVTTEETTTRSDDRYYERGADVYTGYYWVDVIPYEIGSRYQYYQHQVRSTIKVDSLTSSESCVFDPNITVPTYEGDLPVQG